MTDNGNDEFMNEHDLKELLGRYANAPQPEGAFVARLERKLQARQAARSAPAGVTRRGFFGTLSAWWRRGARPRQAIVSALGTVAVLILFLIAAGLFVSWIAGIQQIAGDATTPDAAAVPGSGGDDASNPIADPRLSSPTPFSELSQTPLPESSAPPLQPSPTPPRAADFPHHQNAILVAPSDDMRVPQSEFTRLEIDIVPAIDDLRAHLRAQTVEIVYLHPDVFRDLSSDALRELYEAGILIVVFDTPVSVINVKLPVFSEYDDLAPDTFEDKTQFVAAAFQLQDAYYPSGRARWTFREFYPVDRFWLIVHEAERQWRQIDAAQTGRPPAPTKFPPTVTPFEGNSIEIWTPTAPPPPTVTSTPFPVSTAPSPPGALSTVTATPYVAPSSPTPPPTLPVVDG